MTFVTRAFTGAVCFALLAAPANAGQIQYTYDKLGRIVEVRYSNGTTVTYSYDPNGNRTLVSVTGSPNSAVSAGSSSSNASMAKDTNTYPVASSRTADGGDVLQLP